MGKYRSDPSSSKSHPDNIYARGEIVYIFTDWMSQENQPADCQKLWIWDHKWDPNIKWFYLLKDGPGEKANDVCWMRESKIREWVPPKVEESLDDPPPRYEEVMKE